MRLIELKLFFAATVFVAGGLGILFAWARKGRTHPERFMAWGDSFAGGVLGGAGLLHLLSSGSEQFRKLAPRLHYPFAFALAGVGFLLILLIEGVIAADPDPSQSPLHCGSAAASHEIASTVHAAQMRPWILVLLLVLSVHSVIAGMALGAQGSVTGAIIVFIAIVAHKSVAGFALGISYRRAGYSPRNVAPAATLFCTMTPIGILAGAAVTALVPNAGRHAFEAVFDSLGAGTFLYIAALDIIRTEFEAPGDRWQKWLLVAAGFAVMAALAVWI